MRISLLKNLWVFVMGIEFKLCNLSGLCCKSTLHKTVNKRVPLLNETFEKAFITCFSLQS